MGRSVSAWLLAVLVAGACMPTPPQPAPTASPEAWRPSPASPTYWAYERTLLPPRDEKTYENVLLDAKPLSDGGWIVVRDRRPARWLTDPTVYGPLIKNTRGELLRLDAKGNIVAKEHAAEPLGVTRVEVFEDLGVVVALGPPIRNGNIHALRLDTLDGIATDLVFTCVRVRQSCWTYRAAYMGSTALEERDPRTLAVLRTFPRLTMDNVPAPPAIFPDLNAIAWRRPITPDKTAPSGMRIEPLDPSRPIAIPWLDKLRGACGITQLADDRALVAYGPPGCEGEAGWSSELVEVSTGKVLRRITDDGFSGSDLPAGRLILAATGLAIDPRSGEPGPFLVDKVVGLDFDRGVAAIALPNGGAALLRRHNGGARPRDVAVSTVASGRCSDVDFPLIAVGPADTGCKEMPVRLAAGQMFIAVGRNFRSPVDLDVTGVKVDDATREIEIRYDATAVNRGSPPKTGPARVVQLAQPLTGEWLVRLGAGVHLRDASFVVTFR